MAGQWHGGKGSAQRKAQVSEEQVATNWANIFKKSPKESDDARAEDEAFETLAKQTQVKDSNQGG